MAQEGQALEDQISSFPVPFLTLLKILLLKNLQYLAKILKIELVETCQEKLIIVVQEWK